MVTAANTFTEQNVLKFTVTFTDEASGAVEDPTSVAFGYRVDGGAITTFVYGQGGSIVRVSQGVYMIEVDSTNLPGTWVWEWQSLGAAQASVSGSLTIVPAPMSLFN